MGAISERPWEVPAATGPAARAACLDIEEPHVARMPFDELLAGLDLVAHQIGEGLLQAARGRLVDLDLLQGPGLRVHRGLAELLGVHLAEALEARELHALAGQLEDLATQLREALCRALALTVPIPMGK